jgi:hypothetical protein
MGVDRRGDRAREPTVLSLAGRLGEASVGEGATGYAVKRYAVLSRILR